MTKKIKFYYFAPHPVQYHYGIYKELSKLGNLDFNVIYEDDIGLKPTYVEEFKKEIKWDIDLLDGYPYEFMKNYSSKPHGGFFARVNFGIFKKILIEKPDVILFKTYTNITDFFIMFLAKLTRTKIIFRGEATLRGTENNPTFKQKLKYIFLKNWLKMCDVVMYSCSGNKDYWKFYGVEESKMLPIPCAVDNIFFRNKRKQYISKEDNIKKELGIDKDDFVIIYVSRMNSNKNLETLVESINNIEHKNINLLFVGDGPEKEKIESLCEEYSIKSTFVGFKNISEISKFYSISDLFLLLSKDFENSPKVLNEAMNFELPVIITNLAGTVKDLVEEDKNGYSVNPLDINEISKKIDYLNKNRNIAKQMGQKSLDIVNEWTFEKDAYFINEAIKKIYEEKQ
ncbi:MAG: hypothetical protein DRQ51_04250 [Gammaproteobacteria bacterium]|nr:MAG: hypothetical protein DRQ51_04250 [Gammaproteobacteria bacterium]